MLISASSVASTSSSAISPLKRDGAAWPEGDEVVQDDPDADRQVEVLDRSRRRVGGEHQRAEDEQEVGERQDVDEPGALRDSITVRVSVQSRNTSGGAR